MVDNGSGLDTIKTIKIRRLEKHDCKVNTLQIDKIRELETRYGLHGVKDLARAMRLPEQQVSKLKQLMKQQEEN